MSTKARPHRYVYGDGLDVCHIVDTVTEGRVMTYCTTRLDMGPDSGRIITAHQPVVRLCMKCAVASKQQQ